MTMLIPDVGIKSVNGIESSKMRSIKDFLKGAVYCWCNCKGDDYAFEQAGRDVGYILKKVLKEDSNHSFELTIGYVNRYKWIR